MLVKHCVFGAAYLIEYMSVCKTTCTALLPLALFFIGNPTACLGFTLNLVFGHSSRKKTFHLKHSNFTAYIAPLPFFNEKQSKGVFGVARSW